MQWECKKNYTNLDYKKVQPKSSLQIERYFLHREQVLATWQFLLETELQIKDFNLLLLGKD